MNEAVKIFSIESSTLIMPKIRVFFEFKIAQQLKQSNN